MFMVAFDNSRASDTATPFSTTGIVSTSPGLTVMASVFVERRFPVPFA